MVFSLKGSIGGNDLRNACSRFNRGSVIRNVCSRLDKRCIRRNMLRNSCNGLDKGCIRRNMIRNSCNRLDKGCIRRNMIRNSCNRLDKGCIRRNMGAVVRLGNFYGLCGQVKMLLFRVFSLSLCVSLPPLSLYTLSEGWICDSLAPRLRTLISLQQGTFPVTG